MKRGGFRFVLGGGVLLLSACPGVQPGGFTAVLRLDPIEGETPLTVDYNCFAQGGEDPVVYLIDFDDGETTAEESGSHVFDVPGSYMVVCTATDAEGRQDVEDEEIVVGGGNRG